MSPVQPTSSMTVENHDSLHSKLLVIIGLVLFLTILVAGGAIFVMNQNTSQQPPRTPPTTLVASPIPTNEIIMPTMVSGESSPSGEIPGSQPSSGATDEIEMLIDELSDDSLFSDELSDTELGL